MAAGRIKPTAHGEAIMHTNTASEALQTNSECEASLYELKDAYDAGLLVTTVTPDMINDALMAAVFADMPPVNNNIH